MVDVFFNLAGACGAHHKHRFYVGIPHPGRIDGRHHVYYHCSNDGNRSLPLFARRFFPAEFQRYRYLQQPGGSVPLPLSGLIG